MIVDLFAGPGGWDEGLRMLGITDVVGLEMDLDTCRTRVAAGHATICCDVRNYATAPFARHGVEGIIASPPCQSFSQAGKRQGLKDLRGQLVWQVVRWADACKPEWVTCEQTPTVLPIWKVVAGHLQGRGYNAWAGILNAADYGVPQSRKRAFLLATKGELRLPEPTHAEHPEGGGLFGEERLPWVTMAEALGWYGPSPDDLTAWTWQRPATTVVRSFCPDVIAAPGWRRAGDGPRQNTPGSIRVTPDQLRVLQDVPPDYPFVGSPSKQLSLIGAFLPKRWAAAILGAVISHTKEKAA